MTKYRSEYIRSKVHKFLFIRSEVTKEAHEFSKSESKHNFKFALMAF